MESFISLYVGGFGEVGERKSQCSQFSFYPSVRNLIKSNFEQILFLKQQQQKMIILPVA